MNFKKFFDAAPVGVLISSCETSNIIYVNPFLAQQLKKDVVGENVENVVCKINTKAKNNHFSKDFQINEIDAIDHSENGALYRVHYATVQNNSVPVASDTMLNAILSHYPDAVYFKDKESRFIRVNQSFINRYGEAVAGELTGKTDKDIFDEEHAGEAFDDEGEIMRTGKPVLNKEEKEVNLKTGEVTWVSTSKMPFYDECHNLIGTFGVSKDITHLKRIESQVKESLSILNGITNNVPVVIFKFDKNNKSFEFLGNKTQEEYLRKSKVARLSIEENLGYLVEVASRNKGENSYTVFTSSFSNGEVEKFFDNYVFESVANEDHFIGISIDVTDRKQSDQSIKKHTKSLEKINKELNQFAYIISHDLKAPLRAITNLSEWIEEDLGDQQNDEVKENLQLLRNRVARMESLINGILNYSRASRDTSMEDDIDVAKVIGEVVDSLPIPASFHLEIDEKLPKLRFNRSNLIRIFLNLISNAYKHHNRTDGKISIRYVESDKFHRFSVEDDGPGISAEFHEKIFVIFQTLKARDNFESTGIGLTIVKKIIEDCGGEIKIESGLGKGAKFIFTIPKIIK